MSRILFKTANRTCSDEEYTCGDGTCVSGLWLCDGDVDCTDGSDEDNCSECIQRQSI